MTDQEIYDKVKTHLLTQNRKALNGSHCAYRSPDGCRCAAGCLIPDDLYDPMMEGKAIITVLNSWPKVSVAIGSDMSGKTRALLEELQIIHDSVEVEDWKQALAYCASKFGLTP